VFAIAVFHGGHEPLFSAERISDQRDNRQSLRIRLQPIRVAMLRAPCDGFVEEQMVKLGTRLMAFQPILKLDTRRQELLLERAKARLREAEAQVRLSRIGDRREVALEHVDIARLELADAQKLLRRMVIRASFTGQVWRVFVSPGQFVRAGDPLVQLGDDAAYVFLIPCLKGKCARGQRFPIDSTDGAMKARVVATLPIPPEAGRLAEMLPEAELVRAEIRDPDHKLSDATPLSVPLDAPRESKRGEASESSDRPKTVRLNLSGASAQDADAVDTPDTQDRPSTTDPKAPSVNRATSPEPVVPPTSGQVPQTSIPSPPNPTEASSTPAGSPSGNSTPGAPAAANVATTGSPTSLEEGLADLLSGSEVDIDALQGALDDLQSSVPADLMAQFQTPDGQLDPDKLLNALNPDAFPFNDLAAAQQQLGITPAQVNELQVLLDSYREELEREGLLEFAALGELANEELLAELAQVEGMAEYLRFVAACKGISEHFAEDLGTILDENQLDALRDALPPLDTSNIASLNFGNLPPLSESQRQEIAKSMQEAAKAAQPVLEQLVQKAVKGDTGKELLRKIRDKKREDAKRVLTDEQRTALSTIPASPQQNARSGVNPQNVPKARPPRERPAGQPAIPNAPAPAPPGGLSVFQMALAASGGVICLGLVFLWWRLRRSRKVGKAPEATPRFQPRVPRPEWSITASFRVRVGPRQPCKTIGDALRSAVERLQTEYGDRRDKTGVVVEIDSGDYAESLTIADTFSGRLILRAVDGASVRITSNGDQPIVTLATRGHIRFERMAWDAGGAACCLAIGEAGRKVELQSVQFEGFARAGVEVTSLAEREKGGELSLSHCRFVPGTRHATGVTVATLARDPWPNWKLALKDCEFLGTMSCGLDVRTGIGAISSRRTVFSAALNGIRIAGPAAVWTSLQFINNTFYKCERGVSFVTPGDCDKRRRVRFFNNLFIEPSGAECYVDPSVEAHVFMYCFETLSNNWSSRADDLGLPGEFYIFHDGKRGVQDLEFESLEPGTPGFLVPVAGSLAANSWRFDDSDEWMGAKSPAKPKPGQ
jgi:hypothetical protein